MAFAIFTLGRVGNIERPAIATLNPNIGGTLSVLLDAGGNVDCKPIHLVQFAILGDACAKAMLGIESPRIGLLSNGQEETKGNDLTREAHARIKELVKDLRLNYVGYVEGNDMYTGHVDVVVTDGFVGNVALKISEGTAEVFLNYFREVIAKSWKMKAGYLLLKEAFDQLARRTDYSEYGGAPLLGVDGTVIICHGRSNEKAVKNAIAMAKRLAENNFVESTKERIYL
jgi:glycerol-3-phosphate acyltransferase PlsX